MTSTFTDNALRTKTLKNVNYKSFKLKKNNAVIIIIIIIIIIYFIFHFHLTYKNTKC